MSPGSMRCFPFFCFECYDELIDMHIHVLKCMVNIIDCMWDIDLKRVK